MAEKPICPLVWSCLGSREEIAFKAGKHTKAPIKPWLENFWAVSTAGSLSLEEGPLPPFPWLEGHMDTHFAIRWRAKQRGRSGDLWHAWV